MTSNWPLISICCLLFQYVVLFHVEMVHCDMNNIDDSTKQQNPLFPQHRPWTKNQSPESSSSSSPQFLCGASAQMDSDTLALLSSLHASHNRLYVQWRYIQRDMVWDLPQGATWEQLRKEYNQNPSKLQEWIDSEHRNWKGMDKVVKYSFDNHLEPIVEIAEGNHWCLPEVNRTKFSFDPNSVGKQTYLAYMYTYARATVTRYSSPDISTQRVLLYQIENELNEAYFSSLIGWRKFTLFNNAWNDWDFLTEIMKMLHTAVKDACPDCLATQNVHSDLSEEVHRLSRIKGFYLDAVRDWHPYMDFFSFDGYPNYYVAQPPNPEEIGRRTGEIRKVLKEVGRDDAKIIVMETGYAVSNVSHDLPASLNFTQEHQYEYIHRVASSIVENGGDGLIYFHLVKAPGVLPPPGGYDEQDAKAMEMLSRLSQDEDVLAAVEWLLHPSNWSYLRNRLPDLAGSIESGWGLLEMDGTPRLGVKALKEVCSKAQERYRHVHMKKQKQ